MKKHILIIAGYQMMADFLVAFLQQEFADYTVLRASSMEDTRTLLQHNRIDLVLTDVIGHERSLVSTLKEIRSISPLTRCLVLSGEDHPSWVNQALRSGAKGFITKTMGSKDVVKAVDTVLQGEKYLSHDAQQSLAEHLSYAHCGPLHRSLSAREFEIFIHIGQGTSLKNISDRLRLSASTVAVHKFNIAKKTGIKSTARIARYCIENGLLSCAA